MHRRHMTVDRAPGDEAIHLSIDSNGRIGWLLMELLLVHWNLLWLRLLYLTRTLSGIDRRTTIC